MKETIRELKWVLENVFLTKKKAIEEQQQQKPCKGEKTKSKMSYINPALLVLALT